MGGGTKMAGRDWRAPGGTSTLLATLDNWIMGQSSILVSLDPNLPPAMPVHASGLSRWPQLFWECLYECSSRKESEPQSKLEIRLEIIN